MTGAALDRLAERLVERDRSGLRRTRRTTHGPVGPRQLVAEPAPMADAHRQSDETAVEPPRALLSFCSNDYLGLAAHPTLVAALAEGARLYGAGSGASHLISGHGVAHARLEAQLADFMAPVVPNAAALVFSNGYLANLGVVTALGGADSTLFCDALNHASLIDGARLARARVAVYPHADTTDLAARLAACDTPGKVIVTDGLFSMDGDTAPLADLLALADRHDAWLVVDDAHGFGVHGPNGRGSAALAGLCSERLVLIGTFGKAAGVAGAFVAAHPLVIDWLVQTARSYIYTTAAPAALAHAVSASLCLIAGPEGAARRLALTERIAQLRDGLPLSPLGAGSWLLASTTPVQALIVGSSAAALRAAHTLEAAGIRVPAIRPPTVAEGSARLRISLSAAHTHDDVAQLLTTLRQIAA